jgi:hypothetical protein
MTLDTDIIIPDASEIEENELIQQQLDESIQEFPDAQKGLSGTGWRFGDEIFTRRPLLRARGTTLRLRDQRWWYYAEDNSLFRSAVSGLVKRIQSLPYEIKAPEGYGDYWDKFIRYSNFSNWDSFLGELILPYLIYDIGAFIEIIAPGDPRKPPVAAATGIAVLDSRRCWPTGDPMYPVLYQAAKGKLHLMHRSRVIQFIDMEERDEDMPGWGDSALSRAITPMFRQILMARYMRTFLDDKPPPGFAVAKNLSEQKVMDAWAASQARRENDEDVWGRLVWLYGMAAEVAPALDVITFQKAPAGFDFNTYMSIDAKIMAAALSVDIQEFWELTGQGLGTATQSEILDQKSKGKGIGRLIKGIERIINDVFPDDVEFAFKYRDEEEDLQRAQTAQTWGQFVVTVQDSLTPDETRIILANQVDAIKDAITDNNGNVIRWGDADPKTPGQANPVDDILRLMGQSTNGEQGLDDAQPTSGESVITLNKLIIDQMNRAMIDVYTAAQLLGNKNPAKELRGMFWVGNQLVPQGQLQNIWKYGTLIAPSTTNADLIVETEPEVLDTDETPVVVPSSSPEISQPIGASATPTEEGAPDENLVVAEEKDFRRTRQVFANFWNRTSRQLNDGRINPGAAESSMMIELNVAGRTAWLDGMKRAGIRKPSLDDVATRELATWQARQRRFVRKYIQDIVAGKYTDKQLSNRGIMWANKSLEELLYKAMAVANPRKKWRWVVNFAKENCRSCLRLHNQVHTMLGYLKSGFTPKSSQLICGEGPNCGCRFQAVEPGTKARGRLSSVPRG